MPSRKRRWVLVDGGSTIAIVTGAASGVGRQTSILLAQAGFDVVPVGRTRSKLEATAMHIDSTALVEPVDLTNAAACSALIQRVIAKYAAVKVALNMFTRCTATEGAPIGLQAVTIAPGAIETPMLRAIFDEQAIPRDKTLDPVQVAQLIRDCITGRRTFEPGEVIALPSP